MPYSYNRQRKVAFSSLSDVDEVDADEGLKAAQELLRGFRRYIKKSAPLIAIYKQVAIGLSTPDIATASAAIRERANKMYEALQIIERGLPLFKKFEKEFDDFCEQMGKGTWPEPHQGLIEMVQDLPAARLLFKAGKALGNVLNEIADEDEDQFLWGLEDYVGPQAAIYEDLENNPGDLDAADITLSNPFFEVLKYHSDTTHIQRLIAIYED